MITRKRGLPNQHRRMSQDVAFHMRLAFGRCPACDLNMPPAVIYRRSRSSITFRCETCGLQWRITHANMHWAATRQAEMCRTGNGEHDGFIASVYEAFALATKPAADYESLRTNTITQQQRLGNG